MLNEEKANPVAHDNEIVKSVNRLDQVVVQGAEKSDLFFDRDRMASAHATLELGGKELERLAEAEVKLDTVMREAIKGTPDEAKYDELAKSVEEARKVMQESRAMLKIDELDKLSETIKARDQFVRNLWRKIRIAKLQIQAESNNDKLKEIMGDDRESWSAAGNIDLHFVGKKGNIKGNMTLDEAIKFLTEKWGEEAASYAVEYGYCYAEIDKLEAAN